MAVARKTFQQRIIVANRDATSNESKSLWRKPVSARKPFFTRHVVNLHNGYVQMKCLLCATLRSGNDCCYFWILLAYICYADPPMLLPSSKECNKILNDWVQSDGRKIFMKSKEFIIETWKCCLDSSNFI